MSRCRGSNGSDRAQAAPNLFWTMWSSAASMTSRGWSLSSGRPVPERRPEAVRHRGDPMVLEHLRQRCHGCRPPTAHGEHKPPGTAAERPRGVENARRPPAQWNPVVAAVSTRNANASLIAGERLPVLVRGSQGNPTFATTN